MDGSIYYAQFSTAPYTHSPEWFWKVSKRVCLGASKETRTAPGMTASIALTIDMDVSVPASIGNDQYRRSTKDAFQKRWNETFDTLQKARLHGGEYYIDRSDSGRSIYFHAFLREPSRHYIIYLWQDADTAEINITTENSIIKRRGIANHHPKISENIFIQAFILTLEFFYDGSAIPANQGKLWEVLDILGGSAQPDQPVIINEDYYYQRARELMLKRKEEIKLRLLELDDTPSRRRELRAEMKGIDYCVSILDKNHE